MNLWMPLRMDRRLWMLISAILFIAAGFWQIAPKSKDNYSLWSLIAAVLETGRINMTALIFIMLWALVLAGAALLVGLVLQYTVVMLIDLCKGRKQR